MVINLAKYYFKKHGLIVNPLNEILITPGGKKKLDEIKLKLFINCLILIKKIVLIKFRRWRVTLYIISIFKQG